MIRQMIQFDTAGNPLALLMQFYKEQEKSDRLLWSSFSQETGVMLRNSVKNIFYVLRYLMRLIISTQCLLFC